MTPRAVGRVLWLGAWTLFLRELRRYSKEALETVRRRKFDIILVDLYMSQVSGLEILQATLEA